MQRIEFVGKDEPNLETIDLHTVEQSELITDPQEVEAIIRRAVTILWKQSVFTYDELAAHLSRNYVTLPDSLHERDMFFESVIEKVWQSQKELARAALKPLPLRLRVVGGEKQVYHGVVTPLPAELLYVPEEQPVTEEEATVQEVLATVTEISEKQPGLHTEEIAKKIFTILTAAKGQETVVGVSKLKELIKAERPSTKDASIDAVVRRMVDNGYVTLRKTGHKKNTRWNVVMNQETKEEVLADIKEGAFDEGIEYMFNENTLALSNY